MKRIYIGICISILLIFPSFSEVDALTGETIEMRIGAMDTTYTQQDWSGTGSIKSSDMNKPLSDGASIFFENNQAVFDDLTLTYYKGIIDETAELSPVFANQEQVHIADHLVLVSLNPYKDDKTYIYNAVWVEGNFYINMLSTGVDKIDESGNYIELEKNILMIQEALRDLSPVIPEKNLQIELQTEMNPETGSAYVGLVADDKTTLTLDLELPKAYEGKFELKTLKYGRIIETNLKSETDELEFYSLTYKPNHIENVWPEKAIELFEVKALSSNGSEAVTSIQIELFRPPVFLVHGFTGDETTWKVLDDAISEKGFDAIRKNYDYEDETGESIPAQARALVLHIKEKQMDYAIKNIKPASVDIVAHSMGGLIARYLISELPEYYRHDVRKLIMVGTPNHGCGDIDRLIGWYSAYDLSKHQKAAEQLYSGSDFIKNLNRNERNGKHLDPEVQYGLIYGTNILFGDGVVTQTSAYLNGVHGVAFPGLTHSPVFNSLGEPITTSPTVIDQILNWLETDIPSGEFIGMETKMYAYTGEALIQNPSYNGANEYWISAEASDDLLISDYQGVKTKKGKMELVVSAGDERIGVIYVDQETEFYIENSSPNLIEVTLIKGSLRLSSSPESNRHFMTRLMTNDGIRLAKGKQTDYVITLSDMAKVYGLEGEVEVLSTDTSGDYQMATIKKGQGVKIGIEGNLDQLARPEEVWWDDAFYEVDKAKSSSKLIVVYWICGGCFLLLVFILGIRKLKLKHS